MAPQSCDENGAWIWIEHAAFGFGWWYDSTNNPTGDPIDGIPENNYGDACNSAERIFCFYLLTNACPPGGPEQELSFNINTFADGESGLWFSNTCEDDEIINSGSLFLRCNADSRQGRNLDSNRSRIQPYKIHSA